MELSVIIVNYNVKFFLEQCLCSVIKAIEGIEAEIFVVDNQSKDGSRDMFDHSFPGVRFIWNETNVGFAKANNIALKIATGEYILFLNPDTIIPEDCFQKCLLFIRNHPDTGAMGVHMIDGSGKFLKESKRSFPSPLISLYKLSGLSRMFPHSKTFARYHLGNLPENQDHEVDVLAGAFMMVPRTIIEEVGAFDEDFFMYGEDVDLSYRIQKAGFKNYYFAGSSIIHFKGESTRKGSLNYVRLFYKAMITFVQKHYGGTKAGLFKMFIQVAILFRALISAVGNFIRWIGMPVIDAAIILMSFWMMKGLWNTLFKKDVSYSHNLLNIAFPVFTLIFLAASFYSGLYDNGYKQSRLNRSTFTTLVILLSGYALVPESVRFSRGILVFGTLLAFTIISLIRWLLVKWRVIDSDDEDDEHRQTIIVGSEKEFATANELMLRAGMEERVLGRVDVNGSERNSIGSLHQLNSLLKMYPIREVVLCEGKLSFKQIIDKVKEIPSHTRVKFHARFSQSLIGSDSKDVSGIAVSANASIRLSHPIISRNKKFTGFFIALLLLITFPIHLILQKNTGQFFLNLLDVLTFRKEWVGYAANLKDLPRLKPGVLSSTGLPPSLNSLPIQSLEFSDKWYASDYSIMQDIKLLWKGYKYLGTK